MIAIKGGKIITITQGVIEDGVILVEDGKITAIGKDVAIPEGAQVVDAAGKTVMPGLIDAHSHISHLGSRRCRLLPTATRLLIPTPLNCAAWMPSIRLIPPFLSCVRLVLPHYIPALVRRT